MMLLVFTHNLSVSFASCLLKLYLKAPSLGCCHILVMEDPLLRKVHLGFSSLLLLLSLRISLLKGYLMKLNHLHLLTSDMKKILFNKSSRFPALLDNLYLPVSELRNKQTETKSITPWASDSPSTPSKWVVLLGSPYLQTKL